MQILAAIMLIIWAIAYIFHLIGSAIYWAIENWFFSLPILSISIVLIRIRRRHLAETEQKAAAQKRAEKADRIRLTRQKQEESRALAKKMEEEDRQRALERERLSKEREQSQLRSNIESSLRKAESYKCDLHVIIENVEKTLNTAEAEFEDRVFSPFWDAIDESIKMMRAYLRHLELIQQCFDNCSNNLPKLKSSQHTLDNKIKEIPAPDQSIKRTKDVIRTAQKDKKFTEIYEARMSSKELVAGLKALEVKIGLALSTIDLSADKLLKVAHLKLDQSHIPSPEAITKALDGLQS